MYSAEKIIIYLLRRDINEVTVQSVVFIYANSVNKCSKTFLESQGSE
jgi:hypothetical protein